jgi:methionine-S-sulfoxide reductase
LSKIDNYEKNPAPCPVPRYRRCASCQSWSRPKFALFSDKDCDFCWRLFLVHPTGYSGGTEPNPTYELVTSEKTRYRESIEITYDPTKISYGQLLDIYWRQIDPTQADGQFTDIGPSYRAAIFYSSDEEKKNAEASKEKLARSGKFNRPIVTEILPAMKFYPAEAYHQKYYQQNPAHFEAFEKGSGRVSFEKKTWSGGR